MLSNKRLRHGVFVLIVLFGAFLSYRGDLFNFFTGTDTFSLIESSVVHSWSDIWRILTQQMAEGTDFPHQIRFYRPVATLSYSIDYAIWGLNPLGYHLSNLVLHTMVSLLAYLLLLELLNGRATLAWVAASLFAVHPLHVLVIPDPELRHDILATLFLVLSFWLCIKYRKAPSRSPVLMILSLLAYLFALGSKEVAFILPLLILAHSLIFSNRRNSATIRSFLTDTRFIVIYLLFSFVFVAWRFYILKGLGGYTSPTKSLLFLCDEPLFGLLILKKYVNGLLYHNLSLPEVRLFYLYPSVIIAFLYFLHFFRQGKQPFPRLHRVLSVCTFIVIVLTCMIVIKEGTPQAATTDAPTGFLGISNTPLGTRFSENSTHAVAANIIPQSRDGTIKLLYLALTFLTAVSLMSRNRSEIGAFLGQTSGRALILMVLWLFALWIAFTVTGRFHAYYCYMAVLPFTSSLLIILRESTARIRTRIRPKSFRESSFFSALPIQPLLVGCMIAQVLVPVIALSPLVRDYDEWKTSGMVHSLLLRKLSASLPRLPSDAVLRIHELPTAITPQGRTPTHLRDVWYLNAYGIQSWLNLNYPENRMRVAIASTAVLDSVPTSIRIRHMEVDDQLVELTLEFF